MSDKKYDILLLRSPDSNWWGLESEPIGGSFRWTSARSDFRITTSDIKALDIWVECHPTRCGNIVIKHNGIEILNYVPKEVKWNVLHFDVPDTEGDFEIYCNTFVPLLTDGSNDPRHLGVMIRGFVAHLENEQCLSEMNEIPIIYESPTLKKVQQKFTKGLLLHGPDYTPKPLISSPLKHGVLLYLDRPFPRLMKQLSDYKLSKESRLVTFSGNPEVTTVDIRIDPLENPSKRKYDEANMAFQKGIEIAKEKGWDYFMWLEWDCFLGKDYWYDTLWDELLGWPYKPLQAGTPALSAQSLGGNLEFIKQDYIASYLKANKVRIHMAQNRPFFVCVNGGMGVYETEEAYKQMVVKTIPPISTFDVLYGTRLFEKYQEDVFKHTAWLPSMYSGWAEDDYTEEQRVEMVTSGLKVAMHHYKHNDIPL